MWLHTVRYYRIQYEIWLHTVRDITVYSKRHGRIQKGSIANPNLDVYFYHFQSKEYARLCLFQKIPRQTWLIFSSWQGTFYTLQHAQTHAHREQGQAMCSHFSMLPLIPTYTSRERPSRPVGPEPRALCRFQGGFATGKNLHSIIIIAN
jgi:hypothetical protein